MLKGIDMIICVRKESEEELLLGGGGGGGGGGSSSGDGGGVLDIPYCECFVVAVVLVLVVVVVMVVVVGFVVLVQYLFFFKIDLGLVRGYMPLLAKHPSLRQIRLKGDGRGGNCCCT